MKKKKKTKRHSGYYVLTGRVQFRQRESTREAKMADTHIPPSREKTEKKRYANLPYEQSHPRTYLRQRLLNERSPSSSTFSSSPATTQTNQCDSLLHVTNKAIFFQTSPTDMSSCRRLMQTDFASCRLRTSIGDSSAVSSLMPRPLLFRLDRGDAGFQKYSFRYFCLTDANFFSTGHWT